MDSTACAAMQGTWRTGAPCIISNQEDFISDQDFCFDKRVLHGHEFPEKVDLERSL